MGRIEVGVQPETCSPYVTTGTAPTVESLALSLPFDSSNASQIFTKLKFALFLHSMEAAKRAIVRSDKNTEVANTVRRRTAKGSDRTGHRRRPW